jgi:hypothetical protein
MLINYIMFRHLTNLLFTNIYTVKAEEPPPPKDNIINRLKDLNRIESKVALQEYITHIHKAYPFLKNLNITDEDIIRELEFMHILYGNKPIKSKDSRVSLRSKILTLINKETNEDTVKGLYMILQFYDLI